MFNYYVYINIVSCEPIISLFHLLYNFKILIWSSIAFLIFFFIIISHLVFFLCSSKAPNNVSSLKLTWWKLGFPYGSDGKVSAWNEGNLGLILGLGRSPGEGHGHPSILGWRIPWTEEPVGLQSMGLQSIRHGCVANTTTSKMKIV